MELEDVGKLVSLDNLRGQPMVEVVMVIKAPRGTLAIFKNKYQYFDTQCEGIKAFMEQHRND